MKDRETEGFWNRPTGVLWMLVQSVVDEAVEGGMTEKRANEVYKELCSSIEKQEGAICSCGTCTNKLSMEEVAENFLDRVWLLLSPCLHDDE